MNNFLQKTIFILFLFASSYASAQNTGSATGKIINSKDKTPVDYASVAVKKLSDSSVVGGVNTNPTGTFTINNLPVGKYKLYVVYIGLKTVTKEFELTATKPSINFGSIAMENTGVDLKTVEVKGEIPPVVVKKDTLEFNAANIKVKENAVVEDLVKKLPGVDVARDGTITTQGETIKKVRVDGKDFMGNDPLLATRNLPADMVDKIQIIDDQSEQSKFSGVDDGNREKILNIVTKNGVKNKGFIGNSSVGYGTDDRYDANINVNYFDKAQQISVIGQFNNVNKQNFGGGGGFGGGRGIQFGGGGGGPQRGITTTNAGGINFGDTYDDGTQFNGSYFFNKTSLFNTDNTFTQSLLGANTIINNSNSESTTDRLNHRLNFMIDTKLDSATSIRVQPSISYSDNTANNVTGFKRTALEEIEGNQTLRTASKSPVVSNSLLIRHRFQRRGRTLSLNINTNLNDSDGDNFNYNLENIKVGSITTKELTNQFNDNNTNSFNNTARLVYTEPLSKTLNLELNFQNGYAFDNKERFVFDFNDATQSYDIKSAELSNEFENTTWTNAVGFSLQKNEKKYNWNVGLAGQYTTRENVNVTTKDVLNQDFINLTPTAQFRYNFTNSKRLTIRYNGRTNQPTIDQIQPIRDNTNNQTVPRGNPDLKPAFQNSLNIFYNNFDFATFRTFFVGAFINQYFNAIANDQRLITDATDENRGKIENGYINVDGNFSANIFANMGQPIVKGNKLSLQINLGANYDKSTNFTEGTPNITKSFGLNNGYKLVSNLDKLDLIAGVSGSWNHADYSKAASTNFYTLAPNIDISYLFPGDIRLQTDVTYNQTMGRGEAFNTSFTLVNAYMSRQFFKNKGTFKLSVNDLFNENTGISRSATNNQIIDANFNVLKRYYMLSFTYSLGNVGGRNMNNMPGQGGGGRMRMGGM